MTPRDNVRAGYGTPRSDTIRVTPLDTRSERAYIYRRLPRSIARADLADAERIFNMVTRVSDLTLEELRLLIQETVAQTLADLLRDPDEGLDVREDLKRELSEAMRRNNGTFATKAAADVAAQLGLRW
jgi:hypothetical protein